MISKFRGVILGGLGISVVVIFVFSSTYYGLVGIKNSKDSNFLEGINGSKVTEREIDNLSKFINNDRDDLMVGGFENCNLLNDGIVAKDLFSEVVDFRLLDYCHDSFCGEIYDRASRFKKYVPYDGLEEIWATLSTQFLEDFKKFSAASEESLEETFLSLRNLYLGQKQVSPILARKLLEYNVGYVQDVDCTIFHARSLSDWFGPTFVKRMAFLIANGAIYAKSKGYSVTKEEALSVLFKQSRKVMKDLDYKLGVEIFFRDQAAKLFMTEEEVVETFRTVLLFRRLLYDMKDHLFFDSVLENRMTDFFSQGVVLEVCDLPEAIQKEKDKRKLYTYLSDVLDGNNYKCASQVPFQYLKKRFLINYKSISLEDIYQSICSKTLWDWSINKGWSRLVEEFEFENTSCIDSRAEIIDLLDKSNKVIVNNFVKSKFLEENSDIVAEQLLLQESKSNILTIYSSKEGLSMDGLSNKKDILDLLEGRKVVGKNLKCYTDDGNIFYSVELLDCDKEWQIVSFKECLDEGLFCGLKDCKSDFFEKYIEREYRKLVLGEYSATIPKENNPKKLPLEDLQSQFNLIKKDLSFVRGDTKSPFGDTIFESKDKKWVKLEGENPCFYRIVDTFRGSFDVDTEFQNICSEMGEWEKLSILKSLTRSLPTVQISKAG